MKVEKIHFIISHVLSLKKLDFYSLTNFLDIFLPNFLLIHAILGKIVSVINLLLTWFGVLCLHYFVQNIFSFLGNNLMLSNTFLFFYKWLKTKNPSQYHVILTWMSLHQHFSISNIKENTCIHFLFPIKCLPILEKKKIRFTFIHRSAAS